MKEGNNMVVRVKWRDEPDGGATLMVSNGALVQLVPHRSGSADRVCESWLLCPDNYHNSLAAAKAHVESVLGVERNGGEG